MQKIPSVFRRNPEDMSGPLLRELTPGCEWVLRGDGVPRRKYDGTCVMFDGLDWWARREVKVGKKAPDDFHPLGEDPATGKVMGWVPAESSSFWPYLSEAVEREDHEWNGGTYELCGPRVNGNPEGFVGHRLVWHATAPVVQVAAGMQRMFGESGMVQFYKEIGEYLLSETFEGIVWHHRDGRMAKLKRRDFR